MTIDVLAQSLATLLDISRESTYLLLGGVAGWLIGRYVKFGKSAAPDAFSLTAGMAKPSALMSGQVSSSLTVKAVNMNGGGNIVTLDPAVITAVQHLIQANQKIDAIKRVREITGLGLRDAKVVVEAVEKVMH